MSIVLKMIIYRKSIAPKIPKPSKLGPNHPANKPSEKYL